MSIPVVLGVDIGTSSSKAVLVTLDGRILRSAARAHIVDRPSPGHVEMSAEVWWQEFVDMSMELTLPGDVEVIAVGVSGMGPCVLVTDEQSRPLRPAILYGVDTRAVAQIDALNAALGPAEILDRCGSALSTQAVGPKLGWLQEHEPDVFKRAKRLFMPGSWLAYQLTGSYVLDCQSASQCTPARPARPVAGIAAGVPVITGTIDAWSEALSVGAHGVGDLMLMYGTTMFLISTVKSALTNESMWGTVGALEGTRNLAGGMATSGVITGWLRELVGSPDYATLLAEADASGPGARGLLVLPYFAGERTPIMDPDARGVIAGLTLTHTRGDLYRAVLEAVAFGVRHNIDVMRAAGAVIDRVVAVGGGTQGGLWTQIVSDVTGMTQVIPTITVGASYGAALLAAQLEHDVSISDWNPPAGACQPNGSTAAAYDDLYQLYLNLYPVSREIVHSLGAQTDRPI